ncbi:MAG: hypothetical protein HYX53_00615 [Chloroflexi bacterium]|nr:hypothetical protein [Chloroflexota bacterium]
MGLLSKLLGKEKKDLSQTDRYRMVSGETLPSTEQERMNRDLMESQMAESRAKRDAEQADHKS